MMLAPNTYYAHGKLLLTAEYLVLKGAKALAVPTRLGQSLRVSTLTKNELHWRAKVLDTQWFDVNFDAHLEIIKCSSLDLATKLQSILKPIIHLYPQTKTVLTQKELTTNLEFDINWGLGSSSTLISLLAQWLEVNPYPILEATFGGSGYDLACATSSTPLIYQFINNKPVITPTYFKPIFHQHLYFVYRGQKQNSKREVDKFLLQNTLHDTTIDLVNEITKKMTLATDLSTFGQLMDEHEQLIASCIKQTTVQSELFSDFDGHIKSLGAWGGDFLLIASPLSKQKIIAYFETKKMNVVFAYDDLIL